MQEIGQDAGQTPEWAVPKKCQEAFDHSCLHVEILWKIIDAIESSGHQIQPCRQTLLSFHSRHLMVGVALENTGSISTVQWGQQAVRVESPG
jgi:hypothetical protein